MTNDDQSLTVSEQKQDSPEPKKCPVCGQELEPIQLDGTRRLNNFYRLGDHECPGLFKP